MKTIKDINVKGKKVLLRVDFNVPMSLSGEIVDDRRIRSALPTIKHLLNSGVRELIIVSHLGRPVMRSKEQVQKIINGNRHLILKPIAQRLGQWLKIKKSKFDLSETEGFPLPVYKISSKISLLENIRFLDGESKNDANLSKELSMLADIYVNDAFGVVHRAHASTAGVAAYIPSYAGLLVEKEVKTLSILLKNPPHPFVIILGGAKISDKIMVMRHLLKKADYFLIGGVMANTFLATRGVDTKNSVVERNRINIAKELLDRAAKKIILPIDLIWSRGKIVDIGKNTIDQYKRYIGKAKMVFINGTMGITSMGLERFTRGTEEVIKNMAKGTECKSIVSGGDTISEVDRLKLATKMSFVSTGGGATLEFLGGEKLPGLEVLK